MNIETITTTQDNKPVTTTSEVKATAVTATAAGPDKAVGDVAITFSKEIADALRTTTDAAVEACKLKGRGLGKREDLDGGKSFLASKSGSHEDFERLL